jgi:toxin ParE1/3/4
VKHILRSAEASEDIENVVSHYLEVADASVASRLLDEYDQALNHIASNPGTGSPRYHQTLGSDALRFWTLKKFPYSVFYLERADAIQIIRVLHQSSNIPIHLGN